MNNTEFIDSKMIQGHRYAQRFEIITDCLMDTLIEAKTQPKIEPDI